MMNDSALLRVAAGFRTEAYRLTAHAETEREADSIEMEELEAAFGSNMTELLEEYPEDPRGPSALCLGFTDEGKPIHAVVGFLGHETLVIITVYRPDPALWYDWRRRVQP